MAATKVSEMTTGPKFEAAMGRAWSVARRTPIFGYAEIEVEAQISRPVSVEIVNRWLAAGLVQVRSLHGHGGRKMFELAAEVREPADRTSMLRQQMWTAIRGLPSFTATDLIAHCTEDLKPELREGSAYCQILLKAGYLRVILMASPGVREARYKLIRGNGPKAPRERRVLCVWDENEGKYAHIPGMDLGGHP